MHFPMKSLPSQVLVIVLLASFHNHIQASPTLDPRLLVNDGPAPLAPVWGISDPAQFGIDVQILTSCESLIKLSAQSRPLERVQAGYHFLICLSRIEDSSKDPSTQDVLIVKSCFKEALNELFKGKIDATRLGCMETLVDRLPDDPIEYEIEAGKPVSKPWNEGAAKQGLKCLCDEPEQVHFDGLKDNSTGGAQQMTLSILSTVLVLMAYALF